MPSKLLRMLLCCSPSSSSSANDEPFLHANRPITVATPAVSPSPSPSPPSSTRRLPPPLLPPTTAPHHPLPSPSATTPSPRASTLATTPSPRASTPATTPSPPSSPPATIHPDPLRRRHPSSHYPSSCYTRETSSPEPAATKYPSWYSKSDTVRKMALGPWHPENLRVEFAAGCSAGAAPVGKSIYRLPKRG